MLILERVTIGKVIVRIKADLNMSLRQSRCDREGREGADRRVGKEPGPET